MIILLFVSTASFLIKDSRVGIRSYFGFLKAAVLASWRRPCCDTSEKPERSCSPQAREDYFGFYYTRTV